MVTATNGSNPNAAPVAEVESQPDSPSSRSSRLRKLLSPLWGAREEEPEISRQNTEGSDEAGWCTPNSNEDVSARDAAATLAAAAAALNGDASASEPLVDAVDDQHSPKVLNRFVLSTTLTEPAPVACFGLKKLGEALTSVTAEKAVEDRRVDPDDGNAYTLAEFIVKYEGVYSETEAKNFFVSHCCPAPPTETTENAWELAARIAKAKAVAVEAGALARAAVERSIEELRSRGVKNCVVDATKAAPDMVRNAASTARQMSKERRFQVAAAGATVGAVACGMGCGAVGLSVGAISGAAVGLVPAVFTFGLSIPLLAMLFGGAGLLLGIAVGVVIGILCGGGASFGIYTKRNEIREGVTSLGSAAARTTQSTFALARSKVAGTYSKTTTNVSQTVRSKTFQATAAGAVGGSAACAFGGGVAGVAGGAALGAALGLVPALFTFGLSIPLFAIAFGSVGLFIGVAFGATTGAVGGGAAGMGLYAKRTEIRAGVNQTLANASCRADFVKERMTMSAGYVKEKVATVLPGTGGTEGLS